MFGSRRNSESEKTIKVVLLGDGADGKSTLVRRWFDGTFYESYKPTVIEHHTKENIVFEDNIVTIHCFDTAGQEEYKYLRPSVFQDTDVFLITFSVVDSTSFENLDKKWIPEVKGYNPEALMILVGLQTDLRGESGTDNFEDHVSENEGLMFAARNEINYFECSSRTGEGMEELWEGVIRSVLSPEDARSRFYKSLFRNVSIGIDSPTEEDNILMYKNTLNTLVLGYNGSGKKNLCRVLAAKPFLPENDERYRLIKESVVYYEDCSFYHNESFMNVRLIIPDWLLHEKYQMTDSLFENIDLIIIVYDISDPKTLKSAKERYLPEAKKRREFPEIPISIVGQKCDIDEQQVRYYSKKKRKSRKSGKKRRVSNTLVGGQRRDSRKKKKKKKKMKIGNLALPFSRNKNRRRSESDASIFDSEMRKRSGSNPIKKFVGFLKGGKAGRPSSLGRLNSSGHLRTMIRANSSRPNSESSLSSLSPLSANGEEEEEEEITQREEVFEHKRGSDRKRSPLCHVQEEDEGEEEDRPPKEFYIEKKSEEKEEESIGTFSPEINIIEPDDYNFVSSETVKKTMKKFLGSGKEDWIFEVSALTGENMDVLFRFLKVLGIEKSGAAVDGESEGSESPESVNIYSRVKWKVIEEKRVEKIKKRKRKEEEVEAEMFNKIKEINIRESIDMFMEAVKIFLRRLRSLMDNRTSSFKASARKRTVPLIRLERFNYKLKDFFIQSNPNYFDEDVKETKLATDLATVLLSLFYDSMYEEGNPKLLDFVNFDEFSKRYFDVQKKAENHPLKVLNEYLDIMLCTNIIPPSSETNNHFSISRSSSSENVKGGGGGDGGGGAGSAVQNVSSHLLMPTSPPLSPSSSSDPLTYYFGEFSLFFKERKVVRAKGRKRREMINRKKIIRQMKSKWKSSSSCKDSEDSLFQGYQLVKTKTRFLSDFYQKNVIFRKVYFGSVTKSLVREGKGTLFHPKNKRKIFEGTFFQGRYHGKGKLYSWVKDLAMTIPIHEGTFRNGYKDGPGESYEVETGKYIRGRWNNGSLLRNSDIFSFNFPMFRYTSIEKHLGSSKIVGHGGQGIVYQMKTHLIPSLKDIVNDEYVAVKIMKFRSNMRTDLVFHKIRRGIGLCQNLKSKHILRIFGIVRAQNVLGYIMECCDKSINQLIEDSRNKKYDEGKKERRGSSEMKERSSKEISTFNIPLEEKERILLETARGVEALHQNFIMHRDLKWGNVLMDFDGSIKLTDFDTIKEDESQWRTDSLIQQSFVGTVGFLAPEITHGKEYTLECDVFSFGLMIYSLLFEVHLPYKVMENKKDRKCSCGATIVHIINESKNLDQHVAQCNLRPECTTEIEKFPSYIIDLMIQCWSSNPFERPSFRDILMRFEFEKNRSLKTINLAFPEYGGLVKDQKMYLIKPFRVSNIKKWVETKFKGSVLMELVHEKYGVVGEDQTLIEICEKEQSPKLSAKLDSINEELVVFNHKKEKGISIMERSNVELLKKTQLENERLKQRVKKVEEENEFLKVEKEKVMEDLFRVLECPSSSPERMKMLISQIRNLMELSSDLMKAQNMEKKEEEEEKEEDEGEVEEVEGEDDD